MSGTVGAKIHLHWKTQTAVSDTTLHLQQEKYSVQIHYNPEAATLEYFQQHIAWAVGNMWGNMRKIWKPIKKQNTEIWKYTKYALESYIYVWCTKAYFTYFMFYIYKIWRLSLYIKRAVISLISMFHWHIAVSSVWYWSPDNSKSKHLNQLWGRFFRVA